MEIVGEEFVKGLLFNSLVQRKDEPAVVTYVAESCQSSPSDRF